MSNALPENELCLGDRPDDSFLGASNVSTVQYFEHIIFAICSTFTYKCFVIRLIARAKYKHTTKHRFADRSDRCGRRL